MVGEEEGNVFDAFEENSGGEVDSKGIYMRSTGAGRVGGGKVALVSAFSDDYVVGHMCWSKNQAYAELHGYNIIGGCLNTWQMLEKINFSSRKVLTWYKVWLLLTTLEERQHEWVVWIDADAFVFKQARSLYDILKSVGAKEDTDLVVSRDLTPQCAINCGVIILRNCDFSRILMNDIWQLYLAMSPENALKPFHEQSAMEKQIRKRYNSLLRKSYLAGIAESRSVEVDVPGFSVSEGNVLICSPRDLNSNNAEECNWIFHAAGRCPLSDLIAAGGWSYEQAYFAMMRRKNHIKMDFLRKQSSESMEQLLLDWKYPYIDLSGIDVLDDSVIGLFKARFPEILISNSAISHINVSLCAGFDLENIIKRCGDTLTSIDATDCKLDGEARCMDGLLQTVIDLKASPRKLRHLDLTKTIVGADKKLLCDVCNAHGFVAVDRSHPTFGKKHVATFLQCSTLLIVV